MTSDRFNELVNGPLHHPFPMFAYTRVLMALRAVVDSHPDAEQAFEKYCAERAEQDEQI